MRRVFLVLVLAVGCATTDTVTPPCEPSLIYQYVSQPKVAAGMGLIALTEAVYAHPEIQPKIVAALDEFRLILLEGSISYLRLGLQLRLVGVELSDEVGKRLLIYEAAFGDVFSADLPISECDRGLLLNYFDRIEALLAMPEGRKNASRFNSGRI